MKFLKNVFGIKQNKNAKYTQNTLAETNGSPDLRLATAKEKELDVPIIKKEEIKKIPKKSTSVAKSSTGDNTNKELKSEAEEVRSAVKTGSKSTTAAKKTAKDQIVSDAKKATSVKKSDLEKQDNVVKEGSKKTAKTPSDKSTLDNKSGTSAVIKKVKAQSEEVKDTVKKDAKSTSKKDVTVTENVEEATASKNGKNGKFEIKKSKDGRFVFNLYASNSVIVATSQVYSSSTSAVNGIKSVIANAESAPIEDQTLKKYTTVPYPKWEIYLDKGEEYRFRLCASNGSCVCHSQGYTSKANCKKGIESIIKTSKDAEITKAYLEKKDK